MLVLLGWFTLCCCAVASKNRERVRNQFAIDCTPEKSFESRKPQEGERSLRSHHESESERRPSTDDEHDFCRSSAVDSNDRMDVEWTSRRWAADRRRQLQRTSRTCRNLRFTFFRILRLIHCFQFAFDFLAQLAVHGADYSKRLPVDRILANRTQRSGAVDGAAF